MKRRHLFEFEDFPWFPPALRQYMTRYIVAMHQLLNTSGILAELVDKALKHSNNQQIIDLCSGSGGPMPEVAEILRSEYDYHDLKLTLSDLYPHQKAAQQINQQANGQTIYLTTPVNAAKIDESKLGVRTMICSMHHMRPEIARSILQNAQQAQQPICIYEISDNSIPKGVRWLALPTGFLTVFFVTPLVRPMTWQQLVFTYLIPILPLLIAWDGTVSNIRTYTIDDLDVLLEGLETEDYHWEKGTIKGKGGAKLYLLGLPTINTQTEKTPVEYAEPALT